MSIAFRDKTPKLPEAPDPRAPFPIGDWRPMPDLDPGPAAKVKMWRHPSGVRVISYTIASSHDGAGTRWHWHLSAAREELEARPQDVARALAAFGMRHAKRLGSLTKSNGYCLPCAEAMS